ncbi:MAG: glycoside hydrolase family 15 protein [Gammaproteobacteria bacterium]|nr:glycoside hydrolase family 15 protein [Gammaproteobacteria bacterium]MBU1731502.1 glycoside hydrolase family 15 protein [Gammaproteobacteria bacterium]MBU1893007.1 glycoside hydrolase family 15 protein [Gammaproteobacteria bacterium]
MPRDLPIGNGTLLAAFDFDYQIRDFYYPRVGKENHALGYPWRFGVWLENEFSWLGRETWNLQCSYLPGALVTAVTASHSRLPLRLHFNDAIDYEENILIRQVRLENLSDRPLEPRLFFHADINALENEIGDTVFFDPKNACLIHYKGPRYFLMSCATETTLGVTHFATGTKRHRGMEGTWRDAEDGLLGGNPIAQGAVDSVIGMHLRLAPGGESVCHYWVAAGENYHEVEALHRLVTRMGAERLLDRNTDYWRHWVAAGERDFGGLPPLLGECYRRSLLILRTQIDRGGAVIAANDTDIRQFNQDTYSYMWPRDGAVVSQALDRAGYGSLSWRFLDFCTHKAVNYNYSASILAETGFLMHKYNPDGSVGSSWQPWLENGEMVLPIQEDETALVVWAIWNHYLIHRDIEAIRPFYSPFVEKAADFMLDFRSHRTGLPLPSFDLWEERRGIFTYTTATVIAGLKAAASLAALFHEEERASIYLNGAEEVSNALDRHLYSPDEGRFIRGIVFEGGMERIDATVDSSLLGLVIFGACEPLDERMVSTVRAVEERLWLKTGSGGLARYEGDDYQRMVLRHDVPGNPWVVCTLWLAQYRIAAALSRNELERALPLLMWAAGRALPSGVLPEQVHPESGEFLSVSPLTWSHGTLVATVLDYIAKEQLLASPDTAAAATDRR